MSKKHSWDSGLRGAKYTSGQATLILPAALEVYCLPFTKKSDLWCLLEASQPMSQVPALPSSLPCLQLQSCNPIHRKPTPQKGKQRQMGDGGRCKIRPCTWARLGPALTSLEALWRWGKRCPQLWVRRMRPALGHCACSLASCHLHPGCLE